MSSLVDRISGRRRQLSRTQSFPRLIAYNLGTALLAYYERARQRRALLGLDDRMLKDIGLTRADVDGECRKPFWRG
jgi:uncharacterized protein YjiS (DUF1127 family)